MVEYQGQEDKPDIAGEKNILAKGWALNRKEYHAVIIDIAC